MRFRTNWFLALFLALAAFGGVLSAQINATTGPMNFTAVNQWAQWAVDIDFGATPHTETLTLTCTNSAIGFRVEMVDCSAVAAANAIAAWDAGSPIWNAPTQAAGTWNLTLAGSTPYVTPSLSGQHRIFFNIINPTTATNTITFTFTTTAATATLVGSGFPTPTFNPTSGTPAPVPGSASTAFVEHDVQQVYIISSLGSAADQIRFDFDVTFPATATALQVSMAAILDITAANQLIFDLYSLADANGGTPSQTMTLLATTSTYTRDARSFTTAAYTGSHRFSLVVRAGTPFTGSHLFNAWVTWSHIVVLAGAPTPDPAKVKGPAISYTAPTPAAGALPAGATGTAYATQTFQAAGGQGGPTTWIYTVSSGTLPPGLTLAPAGATATATLSGTPTSAGNYSFSIRASNTTAGYGDEHIERAYTVVVTGVAGPPTLTIVATDAAAAEATPATATGTYTITASSAPASALTVSFTMSGTAAVASGTDYNLSGSTIAYTTGPNGTFTFPASVTSTTITLTPVDDAAAESSETAIMTLNAGAGYTVGAPANGTVNIADNDTTGTPAVSVVATDSAAAETTPANQTGTFTITLSPVSASAITLNFTMSGTASTTPGTDYNLSGTGVTWTGPGGTIAVPASTASVTVTLTPVDDTAVESAETAIMTINTGTGYTVGSPASGTVNIADNDSAGVLTIVTTTLPNGVVGTAYNATITAQNGTGPYTWSLASGTLPTGLTLNTAATGLTTSISGTPTAAGVFTFTVQVADSAAATDTQLYNVTITSSGGGGGGVGGGGGGGGGCAADGNNSQWVVLAAVLGLLFMVVRKRRTA